MFDEQRRLLIAQKEIERVESNLFTDLLINNATTFSSTSPDTAYGTIRLKEDRSLTLSGGSGSNFKHVAILGQAHPYLLGGWGANYTKFTDDAFIYYTSDILRIANSSKQLRIVVHITITNSGQLAVRCAYRNSSSGTIGGYSQTGNITGPTEIDKTLTINSSALLSHDMIGLFISSQIRSCNATISFDFKIL